jgi:hypothetical protein
LPRLSAAVKKDLCHAVTDLGDDEKNMPMNTSPSPTKNSKAVETIDMEVKSSKNRFLDFVKSAIAPRTGEHTATGWRQFRRRYPKKRVPSTPPTTTFLKGGIHGQQNHRR